MILVGVAIGVIFGMQWFYISKIFIGIYTKNQLIKRVLLLLRIEDELLDKGR